MSKKQELLDGLNEDMNLELEAVLRYLYHTATATGLLGHELRELLKGEVAGELNHAVFLADKIAALGGEPNINPTMPKPVKNAKQMLEDDIEAERKVIANYGKRIEQAEAFGDKGLVIRLEDILAEETDHAEELERLGR
ncbi:MAG: ferritin-like domain-containing protein [Planctomycetes bacterium]|nr:ferritin-like domain-containing protein [Planctomycetota bacterium]